MAAGDLFAIVDTSASATKKILAENVIEGCARAGTPGTSLVGFDGTTVTVTAGQTVIKSSNATAFAVGRQAGTSPAFLVDASVSTNVTGVSVTARASGAGVSMAAIGGATDEKLTIDAKGAGTVDLNITGTGNVKIGTNLQLASAKSIVDANGNEIIKTAATVTSAVNEITVTNSATGNPVLLAATGGDTNVGVKIDAKGSGTITLNGTGTGNVITTTDIQLASAKSICDANGNEILKSAATVASAVNEITVTNAAAGAAPSFSSTGGDTNISLTLTPKGTGVVQCQRPVVVKKTQTAKVDSVTLTIAELLTGIIDSDVTQSGQTYTLPTAANLVAGVANAKVGDSFFFIVNNKDATDSLTIAAGSGGTGDGTLTVAANVIRLFHVIITNVTGSSEAYFLYGIG